MNKNIAYLKNLIGYAVDPCARNHWKFSLVEGGIPKAALTAVSGNGRTECVAYFLAQYPESRVAWVEESFSIYPSALFQRGLKWDKVLFVDAENETVWSAIQAVSSQMFDFVILQIKSIEERHLRRLQLLCEKSGTTMVLLVSQPVKHWSLALELYIKKNLYPQKTLEIEVLRRR